MSVVYSLVEDKVKETIAIPAKQEIRELGEKSKVIENLRLEITKAEGIINTYTQIKADLQAKLASINAL